MSAGRPVFFLPLIAMAALSACQKAEHTPTTSERLKNVEVRQQTEPDSYLPRKSVDYMANMKDIKDSPEKAKVEPVQQAPAPAPAAPVSAPVRAPEARPSVPVAPVAVNPAPVATVPAPVQTQVPVVEPVRKVEAVADNSAAQNAYFNNLRAYLASIKRYPTSREARQQRPAGTVQLWLEISRDGKFKDAGVEKTSNSLILDQAALSTLRLGSYSPIPADAWPGQASHRFALSLEYSLGE